MTNLFVYSGLHNTAFIIELKTLKNSLSFLPYLFNFMANF
ncbi:hypothetical protein N409_03010 [Helicobacter pylori FD719]|nr:hypothetical protein N409_03010 [Helicobacter pylori FD719]